MRLLAGRGVDVAFLPVWGWGPTLGPGHLDPPRAAEAVARIRPRVAVPAHWGTLAVAGTRVRGPLGARMRRLLGEAPRQFAGAVAQRGLPTRGLVTEPGGRGALERAATPCGGTGARWRWPGRAGAVRGEPGGAGCSRGPRVIAPTLSPSGAPPPGCWSPTPAGGWRWRARRRREQLDRPRLDRLPGRLLR